jgi:Caspase recruitment domain
LHCLDITKQSHIVSVLSTSDTCSEKPLNDETKTRLTKNYAKLAELIDTKHNLLAELLARDSISSRQKQYIESADSQANINRRLLDILRRGSENDFNKFIACLKKTGQEHVANVLMKDGVIAHVVAKTDCSEAEEKRIVESIKALLDRCPDAGRERLFNQMNT